MSELRIEGATERDVPTILSLIRGLAEYEQLSTECVATEAALRDTLFGPKPAAEVVIGYVADEPVGFALFFQNYSTFLAKPGLYLEDLFVKPEWRRRGFGRALLSHLAAIAVERGYGRMEWSVLDWNAPSIAFYKSLGARAMNEWTTMRVTGDALRALAGPRPKALGLSAGLGSSAGLGPARALGQRPIACFVTGGTFDKTYDELTGKLSFDETHLPEMLRLGRSRVDVSVRTLMMIDSLDMTDADRALIVKSCNDCDTSRIVITHGTDTMVETAAAIAREVRGKTVVLTGAMVPYAFGSSDGLFNLGSALSFVQTLPAGVYIAMNGQAFAWNSVRKNKETGFFERRE